MTRPGADLAESQVPPEKTETRVDAGAPDAGSGPGRVGYWVWSARVWSGPGQGQVGSGRETALLPPPSSCSSSSWPPWRKPTVQPTPTGLTVWRCWLLSWG